MGWVYNLDAPNAPTNAPRLIAIVTVFSIAASLAVALRFYARFFTNRKPGFDDYTALVSVVCVFHCIVALCSREGVERLD